MTRRQAKKILAIDLEMTCDEPEKKDMIKEIIQIGLVEIDPRALVITRRFSALVRPRKLAAVSPFCSSLTGVTAREIRLHGRPWKEVSSTVANAFGPGGKTVIAWGSDDEIIAKACVENEIANPFADARYIDLGRTFRLLFGAEDGKGAIGLDDALRRLSIPWPGRAHDALVDAEATALVWIEISKRLRVSETTMTDDDA